MDMTKIGAFLAQLRKEQNLTQAELGEALGVSNKTVSRWETGSYLPPVEMLQALSERYGVSINELLCGERLEEDAYRERAEETIKAALESSFSYPERLRYFQSKWRKDHLDTVILCALFWAALLAVLRRRRDPGGAGLRAALQPDDAIRGSESVRRGQKRSGKAVGIKNRKQKAATAGVSL